MIRFALPLVFGALLGANAYALHKNQTFSAVGGIVLAGEHPVFVQMDQQLLKTEDIQSVRRAGISISELLAASDRQQWSKQGDWKADVGGQCSFRLHVLGLELASVSCMTISQYEWIAAVKRHPCYIDEPEHADVFVAAVDSAGALNWPHYGKSHSNFVIGNTSTCDKESDWKKLMETSPFYTDPDKYRGRALLIPDTHCAAWKYSSDKRNVVLAESADRTYPHSVIGIASGPSQEQLGVEGFSWRGCDDASSYVFSFVGSVRRGAPVRQKLIDMFNNRTNVNDIWVSKSVDKEQFWKLLASSKFALAPRGDCLWSYRYIEAMVGAAIPVIYADKWVPPFEEVMPLNSYAIDIAEDDYHKTEQLLRGYSEEARMALCTKARTLYERYLSSYDGMLDLVLQTLVLWKDKCSGPFADGPDGCAA